MTPIARVALIVLAALGVAAAPAAAQAPPRLPPPSYSSVQKEVLVTMDDGVKIATTLTFPSRDGQNPAPGRFPVVLAMTPYSRAGTCGCPNMTNFATRGMIGAVADVRGTGGSQGSLSENYFSPRETRDGYNLVEYFGTQPYSNGKVGMAGGSYVGITQTLVAGLQPPHLAAITPAVALADIYRDAFTHGGILNLFFDTQYIAVQGAPGTLGGNSDPALLGDTLKAKIDQSQTPMGFIAFDYLARPFDDPFYRDRSPIYNAHKIKVPALIIEGWRDGFIRGGIEMYQALARRKGVETRLYVDPCTHKGCGAGGFYPTSSPPDLESTTGLIFEFFQKHLLGQKTADRAPVRYYLQSRGGFMNDESWPPKDTDFGRVYLTRSQLIGDQPRDRTTASYFANPAAGISMAFDRHGTVAGTPYVPTDQRAEGPQGATFRTRALTSPLRLAGPIQLHLVATSSANDTDWYGKLADVAPDGSETVISDGMLRASHREVDRGRSRTGAPYHTHTGRKLIAPGQTYEYDFSIWPTAYQLAPGHRLQLRVTSTDFPTHFDGYVHADRSNPAATRLEPLPPATNTIHEGGANGSWLLLPVEGGFDGGLGIAGGGCLARRAPIGPRNVGRVRIGMTRSQLLRHVPRPRRRTKRSWRWCVKGGKGTVTAAFTRKGRVALAGTTAPRHGNRRIHPGTRLRALRRAYPRRRGIGRGLLRANPSSPRLFGLRRGRVRYIAVAPRRTIRRRKALRSYLRYAGLTGKARKRRKGKGRARR